MASTTVSGTSVATPKLTGDSVNNIMMALGKLSKSVAGSANVTLTTTDLLNNVIEVTGVITGNIQVIIPLAPDAASANLISLFNNSTGAFTVTVIGPSGTGIVIATGKRALVYADNTNVVRLTADV
jgi:hypothetical protein